MWKWIVSLMRCRGKHHFIMHFLGKERPGKYSLWMPFPHSGIFDSGFRSLHAGCTSPCPRDFRSGKKESDQGSRYHPKERSMGTKALPRSSRIK